MFDCVWPARTARFGQVITSKGMLNIKSSLNRGAMEPIEEGCPCTACRDYTLSYLCNYMDKNELVAQLLTEHNYTFIFQMIMQMKRCAAIGQLDLGHWVTKF